MKPAQMFPIAAALSAGLLAACGGSSASAATNYNATMAGANETPAVSTSATGAATFAVTGDSIAYTINMTGLSGTPTGAHIHVGAVGVPGPVVIAFPGPFTSMTTITGTCDATCLKTSSSITSVADVLAQMKAGNAYANVHTAANPGGEIRGQIAAY